MAKDEVKTFKNHLSMNPFLDAHDDLIEQVHNVDVKSKLNSDIEDSIATETIGIYRN